MKPQSLIVCLTIFVSLIHVPNLAFSQGARPLSSWRCETYFMGGQLPTLELDHTLPNGDRTLSLYNKINLSTVNAALILGDGGYKAPFISRPSGTLVVSTDIDPVEGVDVIVDNSQPLPFADESFDFVLMNLGLCECCQNNRVCGGVAKGLQPFKAFVREMARIVVSDRPNSMAIATGYRFHNEIVRQLWERAVNQVSAEYPRLNFGIITSEGDFGGFYLVSKGTHPMRRLQSLFSH